MKLCRISRLFFHAASFGSTQVCIFCLLTYWCNHSVVFLTLLACSPASRPCALTCLTIHSLNRRSRADQPGAWLATPKRVVSPFPATFPSGSGNSRPGCKKMCTSVCARVFRVCVFLPLYIGCPLIEETTVIRSVIHECYLQLSLFLKILHI